MHAVPALRGQRSLIGKSSGCLNVYRPPSEIVKEISLVDVTRCTMSAPPPCLPCS
jgi:hypothetical protein